MACSKARACLRSPRRCCWALWASRSGDGRGGRTAAVHRVSIHAGSPLAKSTISRIVQGLKAEVEAWQQRSLAELDLVYLYLDGFHLKVRVAGTVATVPILAVLGVQRSGQKAVVHLSLRGGESTAAWATVCEDLAARGVGAPQLCIIDGSKGLRR